MIENNDWNIFKQYLSLSSSLLADDLWIILLFYEIS